MGDRSPEARKNKKYKCDRYVVADVCNSTLPSYNFICWLQKFSLEVANLSVNWYHTFTLHDDDDNNNNNK